MEQTGSNRGRRGLFACMPIAAIAAVALIPSAAKATFADSCSPLTQSEMAKALHQREVAEKRTALRLPGNSAGVIRDRCNVLAWAGKRPVGTKQEQMRLREGTASTLRMETWVPDEGPTAESWRANFAAKVKGLTSQARRAFVQNGRGGSVVKLPTFGVEHALGFQLSKNGLVKVRAFWWDAGQASIVSMYLVEAPSNPALTSIKEVGREVVPEIK